MKKYILLLAAIIFSFSVLAARAEEWEKYDKPVPTRIVVRVLAHGAKSMSKHTGALVVIRDARTGKELDRGAVDGSTGDDTALMRTGYPRMLGRTGLMKGDKGMLFEDLKAKEGSDNPGKYYDLRDTRSPEELRPVIYESPQEAAKFETVIEIAKPTQIVVEAYGPLLPLHSMTSAMTSVWVFPGQEVGGEGIIVELRGLIVDALDSNREKIFKLEDVKDGIKAPFYMRMMCGCPIAPRGKYGIPWEADGFKITTQAYYKGKLYYEDVTTADKLFRDVSNFVTKAPLPKDLPEGDFKKEKLKIRILAAQPDQDNYGMDEFNVYLSR
jgi:hypothetical protein